MKNELPFALPTKAAMIAESAGTTTHSMPALWLPDAGAAET